MNVVFRMIFKFFLNNVIGVLIYYHHVDVQVYVFRSIRTSIRFDSYTVSFFLLLCVVGICVAIWSSYYMEREEAYIRFSYLVIAFLLRINALIFFSNMYITLIGWDGLGLTSFLLVIFYKNRKSLGSAIITGLTNRLGDCFFICILGYLITQGPQLIVLVLIVCMRITKSAQFPFSAWLPAAMAAPTPVSALVHSSTLVTAGVYVLIRYCHSDPRTLLFIGTCTILLAGMRACVERDFKKVVALRTLSQLGVIMVSLGASEKTFCFFHLISHAVFKALLFLSVGVCIHSVYGTQDYRSFNILMPSLVVSYCRTVAIVSLMGFFFTSGFWSKEVILELLYKTEVGAWVVVFFLRRIGLTACYSSKMLLITHTFGSYSTRGSLSIGGFEKTVKYPLYLLGFFRITIGYHLVPTCRLVTITASVLEKMLPFVLCCLGVLLGYCLSRSRRSFLRRILNITPRTQILACIPSMQEQQKTIDKGWVEAGAFTVSSVSGSVIHLYRPTLSLGLSLLLLLFFFN